ncbi:MarR family winged helix-turn-helix transcriptional regulator [Cytobacillus dafuensis]|uniref:MarR family transcriptional regulator n=1 Tax=Cytobacillus dafuensis TaxID=1742359 RepID=A0A5B8ZA95_CYTDA|nr:MarR family transcriptional regulator [Cytobacillus dafuensis]QED49908.1 MarR family transcriptional regulator [Cytobacillus dafuensis]
MNSHLNTSNWDWEQGPIGRMTKVAYITLRREVEEHLKQIGLTHTQWSALGILNHFPGITSSELEIILMIERPSVTSLMNGLEKKKLIIRKNHPDDARYKQIFLTDEGKKMATETQQITHLVEERVKEGFSADEFETFKKLLIKLVNLFEKK